MSYDVMISHMTHITSHGFHTCGPFERMIGFMGLDRGKGMWAVDSYESTEGFRTMTHYESWGYVTRRS